MRRFRPRTSWKEARSDLGRSHPNRKPSSLQTSRTFSARGLDLSHRHSPSTPVSCMSCQFEVQCLHCRRAFCVLRLDPPLASPFSISILSMSMATLRPFDRLRLSSFPSELARPSPHDVQSIQRNKPTIQTKSSTTRNLRLAPSLSCLHIPTEINSTRSSLTSLD